MQWPKWTDVPDSWRISLAAIVYGLFCILTLRSGVTWSGGGSDLALSVLHGVNVLEGRAFADSSAYMTRNILDGGQPDLFPFLYSLLQGILFSIFGFPSFLLASKILLAICLTASLGFFYLNGRNVHGQGIALFAVSAFALSPFIFQFKEQVRSEFLFMAILFALIWWRNNPGRLRIGIIQEILLLAFGVYFLVGIKSIGIAFVPAVLLHEYVKSRTIRLPTVAGLGLGLLFFAIQAWLLGSSAESRYAEEFGYDIFSIIETGVRNLVSYYYVMTTYFSFGVSQLEFFSRVVFILLMALIAVGYVTSVRSKFALEDVFLLGYACILLMHETVSAWARYLIPILPFLFLYAAIGLKTGVRKIQPRYAPYAMAALSSVVLALHISNYVAHTNFGPIGNGPVHKDFVEIHTFIRDEVPADAVIMSRTPYWTHLQTGRRTASSPRKLDPNNSFDLSDLRSDMKRMGADYLLLNTRERQSTGVYGFDRWTYEDSPRLRQVVADQEEALGLIKIVGIWKLYAPQTDPAP